MSTQLQSISQLQQEIFDLAASVVSTSVEEITSETRFVDDLNYDSIDMIEFVMQAEEKFGIDVPDDEASRIDTVGQVVELLAHKLNLSE